MPTARPINRMTELAASSAGQMAREPEQAERGEHSRQGKQHGDSRGDESTEGEQENRERHRNREELRAMEIPAGRVVECLVRARSAEFADKESRMGERRLVDRL